MDAVVVGAGVAGLAAARELSQSGFTVLVLEARHRLGGRIHTIHDPTAPAPVELGAEFVHGEAEDTFGILQAAGLAVDELPDVHRWARNGRLTSIPDFWDDIDEVRRKIAARFRRANGRDLSMAEYLKRSALPPRRSRMVRHFVEGYHAAHTDLISARSLAAGDEEVDPAGNKQFRLPGGYDAVVRWLRDGLDPDRVTIRLNTIVTRVGWKRGAVRVSGHTGLGSRAGPYTARVGVLALPHAVLRARAVRIEPAIPAKERALDGLEPGQVFKVVLRFRRSFWADDLNFVHGPDAAVPTWWTTLPARTPVLTGWAGGPKAESLLNASETGRVDRALTSLSRVLAVPRRVVDDLLDSWVSHDWRADPFSRAAYTYARVGGLQAQRALARPVSGTLFFAGEATDPEQTGTVAGAIASGRRAARAVLRALRRPA